MSDQPSQRYGSASLAERLFVGTTYVYRGEYPRRDGKPWDRAVQRPRRQQGGEEPSTAPITGTGLEEPEVGSAFAAATAQQGGPNE